MEAREKDIQELCKQVLEASTNYSYNPNGADSTYCPFCSAISHKTDGEDIDKLPHENNCAYNIAKDLSTQQK